MRTASAVAAALAAGVLLGQAAPAAWATFRTQASASAVVGADVLAPPTGVTLGAAACGANGYSVDVTWTPSASDWLHGYELQIATSAAGPFSVVPVSGDPAATSRRVDGLVRKTTYYVVVSATRSAWRASAAAATVTTGQRACL